MIDPLQEYMGSEIETCERKISACYSEVVDLLENDFELALVLFRDFVGKIERQLPREPRRRKLPSKRDAQLISNYKAAPRGTRQNVLAEFERKHGLQEGSALRIYRRHIQHSAQGVFRKALKEPASKG